MANIILGSSGKETHAYIKVEGSVCDELGRNPAYVRLICNSHDDSRKADFPVSVSLERMEALRLIAKIADALAVDPATKTAEELRTAQSPDRAVLVSRS